MYCTKCGVQLRNDDYFCSRCGHPTALGVQTNLVRPLLLDKRNKKIAGVCSGFARYWDVDVVLMRVIWLAVALTTGIGFIAYFAAWMIMPSDHGLDTRVVFNPETQSN